MNYKYIKIIVLSLLLFGCDQTINYNKKSNIKINKKYTNTGFALIYDDELENIKKLENRSLNIYHKTLKKRSKVKITNLKNGNSLIAEVKSNKIKFSNFYNSVLSPRIAEVLALDI